MARKQTRLGANLKSLGSDVTQSLKGIGRTAGDYIEGFVSDVGEAVPMVREEVQESIEEIGDNVQDIYQQVRPTLRGVSRQMEGYLDGKVDEYYSKYSNQLQDQIRQTIDQEIRKYSPWIFLLYVLVGLAVLFSALAMTKLYSKTSRGGGPYTAYVPSVTRMPC
jgi:hypothetical protein